MILKSDQVYQQLRQAILAGEYSYNSQLPKELYLSNLFNVGRRTLRTALAQLEKEHLIERIHGVGTFVSYDSKDVRQRSILVIHSDEAQIDFSWLYILPGIEARIREKQHQCIAVSHTYFKLLSAAQIQAFAEQENIVGVIGILNNFNGDEPIIEKIKLFHKPVLLVDGTRKDYLLTGFSCLSVDEKSAWTNALKHLVFDCGYKKIAIIGLNYKGNIEYRNNSVEDCLNLISEFGGEPIPDLIDGVPYKCDAIENAVAAFLKRQPKLDAILCYSDFFAIYVYEALRKLERKVGSDIAVMGFCGFPDAKLFSPRLSTIDYEYFSMGEQAVDLILEKFQGFRQKETKLRKRFSTILKNNQS